MIGRRRISAQGAGRYRVRLGAAERQLLRALPGQARDLVDTGDPAAARLTPAAYPGDPVAEAEYRLTVGAELLAEHRRALDELAATAGEDQLDQAQLELWLRALEVLRLVVGTQLDITADSEPPPETDPAFGTHLLYAYLSGLQDDVVNALAGGLPDPG